MGEREGSRWSAAGLTADGDSAGTGLVALPAVAETVGSGGAACWLAWAGAAITLRAASAAPRVASSVRGTVTRSASTSAGCFCGRASGRFWGTAGGLAGTSVAASGGPARCGAAGAGTASTAAAGGASCRGTGGGCKSAMVGAAGKPASTPLSTAPRAVWPAWGTGAGARSGALGFARCTVVGKLDRCLAGGLAPVSVAASPAGGSLAAPVGATVIGAGSCKRIRISPAAAMPAGRPPPPNPAPCCVPTSNTSST